MDDREEEYDCVERKNRKKSLCQKRRRLKI
jgi:hypothetical protein